MHHGTQKRFYAECKTIPFNTLRIGLNILAPLLFLIYVTVGWAGTTTLIAVEDTYISNKNATQNNNYGSLSYLKIEKSSQGRPLVRFNQQDISSVITPQRTLTSAILELGHVPDFL